MNLLEKCIVDHIEEEGVVNSIRQLCRDLNGIETSEFCDFRKVESLKHLTNGGQYKLCKMRGCIINYYKLMKFIGDMEEKGLIFTETRRYIDTDTKNNFVFNKRKDTFTFMFIDRKEFEKKILINTLDAYV